MFQLVIPKWLVSSLPPALPCRTRVALLAPPVPCSRRRTALPLLSAQVLLVDSFREAPDYFWTCLQIFKKHPRLAHGFNATPTGPDPIQVLEFELPRALPRGKLTRIKWDMTSQHTLSWDEPITATLWDTELKCDVAVSLRPGSCNLYTFPKVVWKTPAAPSKGFLSLVTSAVAANKKKFDVLEGAYLELLKLVFFTIADSHLERDVLKLPDWSGACSVLAMMVSNNQAALDCCMGIYKRWPEMIAVPHLPGFFVGENAFHVLAVNSQEDTLVDLIKMAHELLSREQIKEAFSSQAMGVFFSGPPMNQYGGTPIAYAASFCMRRAVATYLSLAKDDKVRGSIDLNASDQLCVKSGFSPMHAAVCNGFASMYDFLVDLPELGLNETLKGDEKLKSGIGNVPECLARYGSGLTPLQLACQLGLHDVFDHILRRPTYSSILWKWGPVTQFRINLNGIDSASGQGGEVLELIGRFDAKVLTQEMLLDEFREGFLHKLFEEKWERFGQRMWMVHRLLDLVYLVPLVTNALWLKEAPMVALQQTWLPICTLLTMGPCLEEDVRSAIMWWSGYQGPPSDKLAQFSTWASSHMVTTKVIGCALTAVACIALIVGYKPAGITDEMVWGPDFDQSGRMLHGAAGAAGSKAGTSGEDDIFPIWIFMSLGLLIEMQYFFLALVNPNQELGVLFITINKMLGNDIAKFMQVFVIVFINYGFAMYICYPRTGDVFKPMNSPEFNSLSAAVQALVELALLGETPEVHMGGFQNFNTAQMIEFAFYVLFLFMYLIMALILLLNLLIAMMGNTFAQVQEQAVREWRVANAQSLLRTEMLAKAFFVTNSGEPSGEDWFVMIRQIDKIEEGGGDDKPIELVKPDVNAAAFAIQRKFLQRKAKRLGQPDPYPRPDPMLDDVALESFKSAFALFDKDGSGSISADELGTVMRSLGETPTDAQVKQMVAEVDESGDGEIDFDEFCGMMKKKMRESNEEEELKAAFRCFDQDRSGTITKAELVKILTTLGQPLTPTQVEEVWSEADRDNSGTIEYGEFVGVLMRA